MLGNDELIAFAATKRPDLALAFYRDVLGLTLVEDSPYALVFTGGGRMLRVQKVEEFTPFPFTQLGWNVPDIKAAVAALAANGVVFKRFGFLQQDEAGIWDAGNGDLVAWFGDPDGNTLSLTQFG